MSAVNGRGFFAPHGAENLSDAEDKHNKEIFDLVVHLLGERLTKQGQSMVISLFNRPTDSCFVMTYDAKEMQEEDIDSVLSSIRDVLEEESISGEEA